MTSSSLNPIDKQHYRYVEAFYLSFFKPALYVDVAKRWRGFGFCYFLALMAVITLPLMLRVMTNFSAYFDNVLLAPIAGLPVMYIQEGKVSIEEPVPYRVINRLGNVVAVVDTRPQVTFATHNTATLSLLITKDTLFYRVPSPPKLFLATPTESMPVVKDPIPKNLTMVFDAQTWLKKYHIGFLKYFIQLVIYPTLVFVFFSIEATLILMISLLAQILAQLFIKQTLTYPETLRLLFVAATPQACLLIVVLTFNLMVPWLGLWLLALLAMYFMLGVVSFRQANRTLVRL